MLAALPAAIANPVSLNALYLAQEPGSKRMSRRTLKAVLWYLAVTGKAEEIAVGRASYYRRASRARPIASAVAIRYSSHAGAFNPPSTEIDNLLRILYPLRRGQPVKLFMELPGVQGNKARPDRKRLVLIAPGTLYGAPRSTLLVSILGQGSCLVRPKEPTKVANLVLAGVPAKLAYELMNKLHRVFTEI